MKLKEGDIVLCTVRKIEGTTVFLETEDGQEGSMVLSEVLAGRIRNLREHVSVGKKVVCKVLEIKGNQVEFSLRRVTGKERELVLESAKKEKTLRSILKTVVEKVEEIISKIKEEFDILDFFDEVRENPKILEKFVGKKTAEKLAEILSEKGETAKKITRKFSLKSDAECGVDDIKKILEADAEVRYLGSSVFSISVTGKNFKEAEHKINELMGEIAKRARAGGAVFEVVK